jgi:hypothetical protein
VQRSILSGRCALLPPRFRLRSLTFRRARTEGDCIPRGLLFRSLILLTALSTATGAQTRVWVQHGPGPSKQGQVEGITDKEIVGAINTIAPHPTDANTLYAGAVNGGIWRTTNALAASPTWVNQLGGSGSLAIGAMEFDPTDATNQTLVAGTGRFSSFYSLGGDRAGLWRTTNGGTNWTLIAGAAAGLNINGVAPRGATIVVAANTADVLANRGVWRTTNTGSAWTQISGAAGTGLPTGVAYDLASDPSNNARLFTNAGTNGIYRTADTGATWTKVSNAAMDALIGAASRVEITVGLSNNVFVAIVGGGRLSGLFRSGDGGGTWTSLDLPITTESGVAVGIHPGAQGSTHLSIAADRTNANIVYIGGDRQPFLNEFTTGLCPCFPNSIGANDYSGRLFRVDASMATGSQATHITHTNTTGGSSPHADSRDMAIDASGSLLESDDGGVYRRTTPLLNTGDWFSANGDIKVNEQHDAAWDSNSKVALGGAQDNGIPLQQLPGNTRWQQLTTGDGGDVGIDDRGTPLTSLRYSSYQNFLGFARRTYNTANALIAAAAPALTVVAPGNSLVAQFVTPLAVNAIAPTRLIIGGGNSVYETTDQGATITEIGVGFVVNSQGADPIAYGGFGNADMLYVGVGDRVRVRNAAPPATLNVATTYPGTGTGRLVRGIVMDPANANIAYVIDATNVYRTPDAGATWTNVTGNLATLNPGTILSVAYSNANATGTLIVGTAVGAFSADGPGFNIWSALGVGLPRVPIYDLEFDPVDSLVTAGTLGRGSWTVNMGVRPPTDVALVLDLSGSMQDPACATCTPKLAVLKDAVELFVQLWTTLTAQNDRIGVNYFRTNISEFAVGPDVLVPVQPNAAAIIADVRGQTTTWASMTAMGGGIQTAVNRLTDATRPRHIVVFTDGMQNVNPMVNTTTFVIDNEPGRPASGVSPTSPATDLNAALGRKVSTIGVGATSAFVSLLSSIATETGGVFKLTTAPDADLRRFYVEQLVDVLRDFSPQLVAYRYGTMSGDVATETFTANASARKVILKLSWQRQQRLSFRVEKDGVDVTGNGQMINGPFYQIFSIEVPATVGGANITAGGDWLMRISGTRGGYEAAAIVDEEDFKYQVSMGPGRMLAGQPLQLTARLKFANVPVIDARVTARLLRPKQGWGTLLSKSKTPGTPSGFQQEPLASAAQRKLALLLRDDAFYKAMQPTGEMINLTNNADGTYTANVTNTGISGAYTVVFQIQGTRADIGTYSRTESQSRWIRFGRAVLATSDLRATPAGTSGGNRRYLLHVKPVDAFGNYLGPGYASAIRIQVGGATLADTLSDQLDGSYTVGLGVSAGNPDPVVTVLVFDEPLFVGPLSRMSSSESAQFALSLHTGVGIPLGTFDDGFDPGFLAEADVEYRFNPRVSLEAVLGRYAFDPGHNVQGATLYLKGYTSPATLRWYAAAGAGGYRPKSADAVFGASIGTGLNLRLSRKVEGELGGAYFRLFSAGDDVSFLGLKAGLKLAF